MATKRNRWLAACAAVAALYRYGPSREKARWSWITPGSAFAALAWLLLTLGFGLYVANFGNYDKTYGSLGAVVVLLTWIYLSSYVLLFGAELNSELEHQTAKDTTPGPEQPLGARGAWAADHVAGPSEPPIQPPARPGRAQLPDPAEAKGRPGDAVAPPPPPGHAFVVSRVTGRAARGAGLGKVGPLSSALATAGLALLRRRGRGAAGAALLAGAAELEQLRWPSRSRPDPARKNTAE